MFLIGILNVFILLTLVFFFTHEKVCFQYILTAIFVFVVVPLLAIPIFYSKNPEWTVTNRLIVYLLSIAIGLDIVFIITRIIGSITVWHKIQNIAIFIILNCGILLLILQKEKDVMSLPTWWWVLSYLGRPQFSWTVNKTC